MCKNYDQLCGFIMIVVLFCSYYVLTVNLAPISIGSMFDLGVSLSAPDSEFSLLSFPAAAADPVEEGPLLLIPILT